MYLQTVIPPIPSITESPIDADYHITICNPNHVEGGIPVITVDQKPVAGNIIPDFRDGKRHEVIVALG